MMCSSGTSSPVSADTFFILMRLIVRSSSWLNDTLFLLTAWNNLIGMATNPKLIVPLHTGLGIDHHCALHGGCGNRGSGAGRSATAIRDWPCPCAHQESPRPPGRERFEMGGAGAHISNRTGRPGEPFRQKTNEVGSRPSSARPASR